MILKTSITSVPAVNFAANPVAGGSVAPFVRFMLQQGANREYFLLGVMGAVVQFIIFKLFYPFPDFISDSYNYIDTAALNMPVNLWPVGYAWFLVLVHEVSHSDTFLVGVQYAILQSAVSYFFFTVLYLFRPDRPGRVALFVFLCFNPLFLYLSNCILSDSLFAAISILLITQYLWMLYRPTWGGWILQGVLIGAAFTVRYTAIYYPVVALTALLFSQHKRWAKIVGPLLGFVLIIPFVLLTREKTRERTGNAEFSVFGGWQLANNALYMYDRIDVDSTLLPANTLPLDRLTRQYFATLPDSQRHFSAFTGGYFLKMPYSPLKQYLFQRYSWQGAPGQFRAWGQVSPIYSSYGKALIRQHPTAFVLYFMLPNAKNYLLPPLEKFDNYNLMTASVPVDVQDWFDYITPDVTARSFTFQGKLSYIYPLLFLVLNVYLAGTVGWLLLGRKAKRLDPLLWKGLLLAGCYLGLNFGFSVFAAPVVLRYQVVPLALLFSFSVLLLQFTDARYSKDPLKLQA
jgi:4-amino-4-deoxy-L-arabinose transferase-like glycosyltransferase